MLTIDEFIAQTANDPVPVSAYVNEPLFKTLYVRSFVRIFDGAPVRFIVLANMTVEQQHQGQGVFSRLIDRIRMAYPHLAIYVENVIDTRFQQHLTGRGFAIHMVGYPPSFFVLPGQPIVHIAK